MALGLTSKGLRNLDGVGVFLIELGISMIRLFIPFVMLVIGWIAFVILVRRDEEKVQSEWVALLSPASERIFQEARADIEANTTRVEVAVNEAIEIRELGDLDEAIRFLNLGGDIIQRFTPNLLSLLSVMMKFSRMIGAIAPVNPILPQGFHLAELTSLAHLNGMLHRVLTSAKQRFRLKLYILGKGISITSHYLLKRIGSIVTHRSSEDSDWEQILGVEQDFQRLSSESVQGFQNLLQALSNEGVRELSRTLGIPSSLRAQGQSPKSTMALVKYS